MKINLPKTTDDFNPYSINDGMNEIDLLMEELEKDIPDDAYDHDEFDIEEMLKSNRVIKDRIREIAVIVSAAITKAAILKKTVVTHRDLPENPEVRKRVIQIKKHQSDITKCKKYIQTLKARIDSVADSGRMEHAKNGIHKLERDARRLDRHKAELNKKLNNQVSTIKKLYSDPDYKDKVTGLHDEIKKHKEMYDKMKEQRKGIKAKQKQVINEMADTDLACRQLKEKKVAIQNNIKPTKEMETMTEVDEYEDL